MQALPSFRAQALVFSFAFALAACGGGGGGNSNQADVGEMKQKPGTGEPFFVDPHQNGRASALLLPEVSWGRLVDVHDVDGSGEPSAEPMLRDVVVRPDLEENGVDFDFESDPLGRTALIILHTRGTAEFEAALRDAAQELPELEAKADDGSSPGPFGMVARNAAIVLRVDDLLDDDADALDGLVESVRILIGYSSRVPQEVRLLFDALHGGIAEDQSFHSTRVIVDTTVSLDEGLTDPREVNLVGLPPSLVTTGQPNVSVRLGTQEDFGSGQFHVLRNLRGRGLDPDRNGPSDPSAPTVDVVRALRSGNPNDEDNGFLPDDVAPSLVGRWLVSVTDVAVASADSFELELVFANACRKALVAGELLETNEGFLEVTEDSAAPDVDGRISGVAARARSEIADVDGLLGFGHVWTTLAATSTVEPACFVEVVGAASADPGAPIPTDARVRVRFNEPMEPDSFDALDSVRLFSGAAADATSTVVSRVLSTADSTAYELEPVVGLAHQVGNAETYSFEIVAGDVGPTDLAGNALADSLPAVTLTLDPAAASVQSGGITLRFASADDYEAPIAGDGEDVRGLFTIDAERGVMLPRPVVHASWPLDGSTPTTARMLRLPIGIREPLGRLGSRLQTVWRYVDANWKVADESKYDMDVEGMSWAPFGGAVISDFFEKFELRLAHSFQLPDEALDPAGAVLFPGSGLFAPPNNTFDDNSLDFVTHPVTLRDLGYRIQQLDLFQTPSGMRMIPFPLDEAKGALDPFVWRDTSMEGVGGAFGAGVPMQIENALDPSVVVGSVAFPGAVPTFGLPLLIELRVFPSDVAFALNDFQVGVFNNGPVVPFARIHSTGGMSGSTPLEVQPDNEPVARGGLDPTSVSGTAALPAFYFGQLDTVTRVSRVHTVWFDSGAANAIWSEPIVTPDPSRRPTGTQIVIEYRGARSFSGTNGAEVDALGIDPYGAVREGSVSFANLDDNWKSDITQVTGGRYLQMRITFVNDVETGISPELDSIAVPFSH